jgi:hypothetical protein
MSKLLANAKRINIFYKGMNWELIFNSQFMPRHQFSNWSQLMPRHELEGTQAVTNRFNNFNFFFHPIIFLIVIMQFTALR